MHQIIVDVTYERFELVLKFGRILETNNLNKAK